MHIDYQENSVSELGKRGIVHPTAIYMSEQPCMKRLKWNCSIFGRLILNHSVMYMKCFLGYGA
jgi:hypothetical protein